MSLKEIIKNRILNTERSDLQAIKEMYEVYKSDADLDEESSLGNEEFAKQHESRESARGLAIRIERAQSLLKAFLQLDFGPKSKVEPGALVLTDSLNFFVGMASALFEYEGKSYIGINMDAPIYSMLRNAQVGDEVFFNNKKYTILDIL